MNILLSYWLKMLKCMCVLVFHPIFTNWSVISWYSFWYSKHTLISTKSWPSAFLLQTPLHSVIEFPPWLARWYVISFPSPSWLWLHNIYNGFIIAHSTRYQKTSISYCSIQREIRKAMVYRVIFFFFKRYLAHPLPHLLFLPSMYQNTWVLSFGRAQYATSCKMLIISKTIKHHLCFTIKH